MKWWVRWSLVRSALVICWFLPLMIVLLSSFWWKSTPWSSSKERSTPLVLIVFECRLGSESCTYSQPGFGQPELPACVSIEQGLVSRQFYRQTGSYIVWVIQSLCQHRAPSIGWSADRSSKICITGRSKATFEIAINSHILNTLHVNELWVENIDMSKPCHKIHLGTVDEQIMY